MSLDQIIRRKGLHFSLLKNNKGIPFLPPKHAREFSNNLNEHQQFDQTYKDSESVTESNIPESLKMTHLPSSEKGEVANANCYDPK